MLNIVLVSDISCTLTLMGDCLARTGWDIDEVSPSRIVVREVDNWVDDVYVAIDVFDGMREYECPQLGRICQLLASPVFFSFVYLRRDLVIRVLDSLKLPGMFVDAGASWISLEQFIKQELSAEV